MVAFSSHADDMLRERKVASWQVIAGVGEGRMLIERPHDRPNPVAEVEQTLADGTPYKAVWAFAKRRGLAVVVTIHFFDR